LRSNPKPVQIAEEDFSDFPHVACHDARVALSQSVLLESLSGSIFRIRHTVAEDRKAIAVPKGTLSR
jgi:hypothetical protein